MIYLLALGLFVWLLGYADERTGLRQHNYKNYLIIAGSVVALIMGLRTKYTGSSDTYAYSEIIYNVISITVKNGMVDILSKDRHRVFRDDEVTLFIEILLDNSLP